MTTEVQNRDMLEFAALYREKLDLQERVNEINKTLEDRQDALLNYFAEMGWEKPPQVLAAHPHTPEWDLLDEVAQALVAGGPPPESFLERLQAALAPKRITLYIESKLWAGKKPEAKSEDACEALRQNGYEHLVTPTFNVQTLSAVARELEERGESFPTAVLDHIQLTTAINIRARRA